MSDIADIASKYEQEYIARCIAAARGDIPPGQPGECELCGELSERLIGGACAPCRDRYKL